MSSRFTVQYETLTGIYTGNVGGKNGRVRETGLMGGLRWWFEALVRGAGGLAYKPERSMLDPNRYKPLLERRDTLTEVQWRSELRGAGLDDAAQVFGATGWRRRFRLMVNDVRMQPDKSRKTTVFVSSRQHIKYNPRTKKVEPTDPEWVLPDHPRVGQLDVAVASLDPTFDADIIGGLLHFIERRAGLGAKNQHGFGVVKRIGGDATSGVALLNWLAGVRPITSMQQRQTAMLPSITNCFFAEFHAPNMDTIEKFYELRIDLRQRLGGNNNDAVRHFVFGEVSGNQRVASKIELSEPFGPQDTVRLWGWLPFTPAQYNATWSRDNILDAVKAQLLTVDSNLSWREFNSSRDNVSPEADFTQFLTNLLT